MITHMIAAPGKWPTDPTVCEVDFGIELDRLGDEMATTMEEQVTCSTCKRGMKERRKSF